MSTDRASVHVSRIHNDNCKWSKNFDKRPHRTAADFSREQCINRPISLANAAMVVKKFRLKAASQGRIFHMGKVNVTPASREQCSPLPQSC